MVSKPLPFLVYCFSSSISFIQPFESGMTRSYHFYNHIYIYMYVYGEIIPLYGSKNAGVLSMPLRFPPTPVSMMKGGIYYLSATMETNKACRTQREWIPRSP